MIRRITGADAAASAGVLLGLIAAFVPWYSYSTATSRVTVDGFRASLLGDLFFLVVAATAVLVLSRLRVIDVPQLRHVRTGQALGAIAGAAAALVVLQLLLNVVSGGRSLGAGFLIAFLAVIALGAAAWLAQSALPRRFSPHAAVEEDLFD